MRSVSLFTVLLLASICSACQTTQESQPASVVEIHLASQEPQPGFRPMISEMIGDTVYVSPEVVISNEDIERAWFVRDAQGNPAVDIEFDVQGREKFARFTASHVGDRAAILVDGRITSAPVIRAEIGAGLATITGHFTEEEAKTLANSLVPDD